MDLETCLWNSYLANCAGFIFQSQHQSFWPEYLYSLQVLPFTGDQMTKPQHSRWCEGVLAVNTTAFACIVVIRISMQCIGIGLTIFSRKISRIQSPHYEFHYPFLKVSGQFGIISSSAEVLRDPTIIFF